MTNKIKRNEFIVALFLFTLISFQKSKDFNINNHINLDFFLQNKNREHFNIVKSFYSKIKKLNFKNFDELIFCLNSIIKKEYDAKQLLIFKGLLLSHTEYSLMRLQFKL
jgi:hypothetical protein